MQGTEKQVMLQMPKHETLLKSRPITNSFTVTCRQQLITILSQELSGVEGIHDIWKQTGRPCIPRLLCSFQQVRNAGEFL